MKPFIFDVRKVQMTKKMNSRCRNYLGLRSWFFVVINCVLMTQACAGDFPKKPNIVLIMADDMGYECLSVNGSDDYKTPRLDALAREGINYMQCFSNPLCTPSRVKIMTGLYNKRNYVKFGVLERSQVTFAHELKKRGYATAIAGKWQLDKDPYAAKHFGFDEWCLWQNTRRKEKAGTKFDSRYPNPNLEINGKEVDFRNGEYGPDVCADFICDFIEKNKNQPFLAYYPMILPHCPYDVTPDSKGWNSSSPGSKKYEGVGGPKVLKSNFADMVHYVDKIVGRIDDQLRRLGLRENTILIFTGDNGTGPPVSSKWKNRTIDAGKKYLKDSGIRVPLVISWPTVIKPRVEKNELVDFSDFFPTMLELADGDLPKSYSGDGESLVPSIKDTGNRKKDFVYIWYQGKSYVRTISHSVVLDEKKSEYSYEKYSGHYTSRKFDESTVLDEDKTTFEHLKSITDRMSKIKSWGR